MKKQVRIAISLCALWTFWRSAVVATLRYIWITICKNRPFDFNFVNSESNIKYLFNLFFSFKCLDRLNGSSSVSETYGNPCLANSEDFEVKEVEVHFGF